MTATTNRTSILALVSLVVLLLGLLISTAAVADEDDDAGDPAADCELEDGTGIDDVDECEDGDGSDKDDDGPDDDRGKGSFKDVPGDLPHVEGIAWLSDTGVTKGCKLGKFCPNRPVTRAELATLLGRLLGELDDVDPVAAPADELAVLQAQVEDLAERVEALEESQTTSSS